MTVKVTFIDNSVLRAEAEFVHMQIYDKPIIHFQKIEKGEGTKCGTVTNLISAHENQIKSIEWS